MPVASCMLDGLDVNPHSSMEATTYSNRTFRFSSYYMSMPDLDLGRYIQHPASDHPAGSFGHLTCACDVNPQGIGGRSPAKLTVNLADKRVFRWALGVLFCCPCYGTLAACCVLSFFSGMLLSRTRSPPQNNKSRHIFAPRPAFSFLHANEPTTNQQTSQP